MARNTGVGQFRVDFERGLYQYQEQHPEFDLAACAMELIKKAYDRGDDRVFFGGLAQLAKILGPTDRDAGQEGLLLVVDRRAPALPAAAHQ